MKTTANYGLKKPDGTDVVNIEELNYNVDVIDIKIKEVDDKVSNVKVPVTSVNNKIGAVNLSADDIGAVSTKDFTSKMADYVRQPAYAVCTGSANAYIITTTPAPTSYVDGMGVAVKINVASTGASTLNWNGLGAKSIVDSNDKSVTNLKTNAIYEFKYNSTLGKFILQGNSDADTVKGVQYFVESTDPATIAGYSVKDRDVWIDMQNLIIKGRVSNAWVAMGAVYQ